MTVYGHGDRLWITHSLSPSASEKVCRLGAEARCRNQGIMRGLIGVRLLRRFTGHNLHSPELPAVSESASIHTDGEVADSSNNGNIYTPPEHSDSTVHETKTEPQAAEQPEHA